MKMMEISVEKAGIYKYSIPFVSPLRVGTQTLDKREGFVVELTRADGIRGYGEIAPLEGFSVETLEQAEGQILELVERLPGMVFNIDFERRRCRFPVINNLPGNLYASCCFGLETAILQLVEIGLTKPFSAIVSQKPKKRIAVNALLHLTDVSQVGVGEEVGKLVADGFNVIKIKVGRRAAVEDIEIVNRTAEVLPAGVRLRLDANRLWDFETALEFGKKVDKRFIEYIEEPFVINDTGQISEFYSQTGIGVALDESLSSIDFSGSGIPVELAAVKAFILKPTLLGGFGRTGEWVDLAMGYGIESVISSCFEVGPGFMALLKMAAVIGSAESVFGLDTLKYLKGNLFSQPVEIENGFINIEKVSALINQKFLEVQKPFFKKVSGRRRHLIR